MPKKISDQTKDRAVRLVLDHLDEYETLTAACVWVGKKVGASKSRCGDGPAEIVDALAVPTYFAEAYCAWQRGTNEHFNGRLRRYLPKRSGFDELTQTELEEIVTEINNRPRKCLAEATLAEVFGELSSEEVTPCCTLTRIRDQTRDAPSVLQCKKQLRSRRLPFGESHRGSTPHARQPRENHMSSTNARKSTPPTRTRGTKRTAIVLAAILTVAGGAAAFAYWTSTGTGDGEATTGQSTKFVIASEDAVGEIAPGSAGQTVKFTVTNPGPGTQNLANVAVTLADDEGTAWVPTGDCLIADYSASVTTAPTYGEIAAEGSVEGTVTVTLENTTENQDDCQGQTVPLHFVAS